MNIDALHNVSADLQQTQTNLMGHVIDYRYFSMVCGININHHCNDHSSLTDELELNSQRRQVGPIKDRNCL